MGELPAGNWGQESAEEQAARAASYKNVDYLTLQAGPNKLRFVGNYVFRHMHYYEDGKRPHIVCIGAEQCPVCKLGFSTNFYYYCNVLDRADEKVKILRFGSGVKKRLDVIANKYGPLSNYDIEITREGKGKETSYPSVLPEPPASSKPISDILMKQIQENMYDLGDIYKIPTGQEVQDAMQPKDSDNTPTQKPAVQQHAPAASTVSQPPKDAPSGLQEDTGEIIPLATGKLIKACYGDATIFNPQRAECIPCPLRVKGCKRRVLAFYTGEIIQDTVAK